jgi:dihydroorotate dehydrogenase
MKYSALRPWLFRLDPELSHHLTLKTIKFLASIRLLSPLLPTQEFTNPKTIFGLSFKNPIGLAAGLDKNGDYIDALGQLGFGFIEVGTVTPKPQPGNPKPRLFRLTKQQALINRMGFNNKGVDHLVRQLQNKRYLGVIGVNIGKNATTPIENAANDYIECMTKVYPYANYITVNISSPNTPGLRDLQGSHYLQDLLVKLKKGQAQLSEKYGFYVPLLIKIAPDITDEEITKIAEVFIENKIDGIVATNTTIARPQISDSKLANESGGLSGQPLFESSTHVLKKIKSALNGAAIPIIGSGGIMTAQQANDKLVAGADLIQLYTGLIYSGPALIQQCLQNLNSIGQL